MPCTRTLLSGVKFIVAGCAGAGLRLTKLARFFLSKGNFQETAREHNFAQYSQDTNVIQCFTNVANT